MENYFNCIKVVIVGGVVEANKYNVFSYLDQKFKGKSVCFDVLAKDKRFQFEATLSYILHVFINDQNYQVNTNPLKVDEYLFQETKPIMFLLPLEYIGTFDQGTELYKVFYPCIKELVSFLEKNN